jgi:hypothetical protein
VVIRYCLLLALCLAAGARANEKVGEVQPVVTAETALREALFTRTFNGESFGRDALDIFFWDSTRHLLTEPSHSQAIRALDEFMEQRGEKSMSDPLRRALLQRDLWQLFEWASGNLADIGNDYQRERSELRSRIAAVMKRVALQPVEIAQLPDNIATASGAADIADFPRGVLDGSGDWVMLGTAGEEVAAPVHVKDFDGHSAFLVLLRLPGGRAATQAWLKTPGELATANFPAGTMFGLVRLMLLVDAGGRVTPTRIVESIQLRRYVAAPPSRVQVTFEIVMDRTNPPSLRALERDEMGYPFLIFGSQGVDLFENPPATAQPWHPASAKEPVLKTCMMCHGMPGIASIRSYFGFNGRQTPANQPTTLDRELAKTITWQSARPQWQELTSLMAP